MTAEGTPEEIAAAPGSYTGQFLAPILAGRNVQTAADIVDDIARAEVALAPAPKRPRRNSATGIGVNGSSSAALNSSAALPGTSTASRMAAAAGAPKAAAKNGARVPTRAAPVKTAPARPAPAKSAPTKTVAVKPGSTEQSTIAAKARRKAAKLI